MGSSPNIPAPAAVSGGLASAAIEAVEDVCYALNIVGTGGWINHPTGGSSPYFTSPEAGLVRTRLVPGTGHVPIGRGRRPETNRNARGANRSAITSNQT